MLLLSRGRDYSDGSVTGKTKHFYHDPGDLPASGITLSSPTGEEEQAGLGSAPARRSTN